MKRALLILPILISLNSFAQGKLGLLITAHGSPSKQWNQPVLELENQVREVLKTKSIIGFDEVRVALMEFAEPSISTAINEMEKNGIAEVYVIPLFVAPSGHSIKDLPTILGLYYDKEYCNTILGEGIEIVDTDIKITIGPTLSYNDLIKEIIADQVRSVSEKPKNEALIILSHGDSDYSDAWESFVNNTGSYILGNIGIEYFDKAFVGAGQRFVNAFEPIIRASEVKEKVIVVGIYLSMDAKTLAESSGYIMMERSFNAVDRLQEVNVEFVDGSLLDDMRIANWIVSRSLEWLKN